jgi:hypothetical protein
MAEVFDVVYFAFIMLIVIIYIYIIIVLVLNSNVVPFNSTFFVLWINLGIVDIAATLLIRVFGSYVNAPWLLWKNLKVVTT